MELKRLGLRIKELRTKKGLTQDVLSELAEMNSKHLSEVERGSVNISIQNLDKIAEALEVPILDLLEIEHQKSKDELRHEVMRLLDQAEHKEVQIIYRLIKNILG